MFLIFRSAQILLERKKKVQLFLTDLSERIKILSLVSYYFTVILNISRLIETNTFRSFSVFTRLNEMMKEKKKKETIFLLTDNINSINVDEHAEQKVNKRAFPVLVPRIFRLASFVTFNFLIILFRNAIN